jgi:hypothetical protein
VIPVASEEAEEAHTRVRDLEAVSDDTIEHRLVLDEPSLPRRDAAEGTGPLAECVWRAARHSRYSLGGEYRAASRPASSPISVRSVRNRQPV